MFIAIQVLRKVVLHRHVLEINTVLHYNELTVGFYATKAAVWENSHAALIV